MGILKTMAVKGIIPAGNKVKELRINLFRLITEMPFVLEKRFGAGGLDAISEIFQHLGEQDAITITNQLGLGKTLKDAVDAWVLIGHIMESKMNVTWENDNRAITEHPYCPQYEEFKKKGKLYCEYTCWPYVGTVGAMIAPGVKMEILRPADMNKSCRKALVYTLSKDE
ncbi:MAG: hypothetical protein ACFFDQ_06510 [Candidatus Thorarchaeota archaeon]